MDTLDVLLRDDGNFKQGIYWCLRHREDPSERLQYLLRKDRVYLVRIDGFDEFLADLHKSTNKSLPKAIARPFEMARERADLFVNIPASLNLHPVIQEHKKELLTSIAEDTPVLPLTMQASILGSMGQLDDAILLWEKAFEQEPTEKRLAYRYAEALASGERYEQLREFIKRAPFASEDATFFYLRAFHNGDVIALASYILDSQLYGRQTLDNSRLSIVRINRAIALKRLGRFDEMEADLDYLEDNGYTGDDNIRAGVAALRKDKTGMFEALNECLFKTVFPPQLETFPVFEDYQDDPDFLGFISSVRDGMVDRGARQLYDRVEPEEGEIMPGPDY